MYYYYYDDVDTNFYTVIVYQTNLAIPGSFIKNNNNKNNYNYRH